jgi:hypothetical protein
MVVGLPSRRYPKRNIGKYIGLEDSLVNPDIEGIKIYLRA